MGQFRKAIELRPDCVAARIDLANVLAQRGQVDEAISQLRKAIEFEPRDAMAHYNLGLFLLQSGRTEQGLAQLQQALELAPDSMDTHMALARFYRRHGQLEQALAHYAAALRAKPDEPEALNDMAWIRAAAPQPHLRNGPEAVRLAERACELTAYKEPLLIRTLAAACAESGRFDEAATLAGKARDLAAAAGQKEIAGMNQELLDLFRAGKPYHEAER